tara:strand:- start:58 stop:471 length:414 start_codon:yes stop_codon:yes gene_type:complete
MSDVTNVTHNGQTYALFFSKNMTTDSIQFLTEDEDAFQVGLMEREEGYTVEPHQHTERPIELSTVSEFIYVEKGKVKVTVFDEEWNELDQHELSGGDSLLFLRGGHSLEVLEAARMIEVKQGPYPGEENAKIFQSKS